MRFVSLLPSATEILFALGLEGVELLAHLFHPERFPKEWPKDAVQRMAG